MADFPVSVCIYSNIQISEIAKKIQKHSFASIILNYKTLNYRVKYHITSFTNNLSITLSQSYSWSITLGQSHSQLECPTELELQS